MVVIKLHIRACSCNYQNNACVTILFYHTNIAYNGNEEIDNLFNKIGL